MNRDDGGEQDDPLQKILCGIGHVQNGHAVQHGSDQQRTQNHIDDSAAPPGKANAAQNHDENDIVDQCRVENRVGIELTDAASTKPAKQPISAAITYCSTIIGRVGIPVTRAAG